MRALAGGSGEVFSQHGRGTDDPDRYGGPFRRHDDPPIDRSPGGRGSGGYESEHTWGESEAPRADVDRPSDESIRENVLDQLDRHEEIDAAGIEVLVEEGEVTLQGTVADPDMRWLAEGVAESVAGVSLVHNRLRLARP